MDDKGYAADTLNHGARVSQSDMEIFAVGRFPQGALLTPLKLGATALFCYDN